MGEMIKTFEMKVEDGYEIGYDINAAYEAKNTKMWLKLK